MHRQVLPPPPLNPWNQSVRFEQLSEETDRQIEIQLKLDNLTDYNVKIE